MIPLFFYFCLPVFEQVLLVRTRPRGAFLGVAVLVVASVVVNGVGASSHAALCWSATPAYINNDPGRVWDWSDPQFARPFKALAHGRSLASVLVGNCPTGATLLSAG